MDQEEPRPVARRRTAAQWRPARWAGTRRGGGHLFWGEDVPRFRSVPSRDTKPDLPAARPAAPREARAAIEGSGPSRVEDTVMSLLRVLLVFLVTIATMLFGLAPVLIVSGGLLLGCALAWACFPNHRLLIATIACIAVCIAMISYLAAWHNR